MTQHLVNFACTLFHLYFSILSYLQETSFFHFLSFGDLPSLLHSEIRLGCSSPPFTLSSLSSPALTLCVLPSFGLWVQKLYTCGRSVVYDLGHLHWKASVFTHCGQFKAGSVKSRLFIWFGVPCVLSDNS